jgi:hypothetical protein
MVIVKEECAQSNLPLHYECTRAASFRLRVPESVVWNARKIADDIKTPLQQTRELCEEVLWWHSQTGQAVTFADIMSTSRLRHIVYARRDCMRRLREVRGWSYPQIGKYFGGMDHTTVMHNLSKKIMDAVVKPPKPPRLPKLPRVPTQREIQWQTRKASEKRLAEMGLVGNPNNGGAA